MSKRLILCNLKELYAVHKLKFPGHKIGFSKFASLRPKWCILAGPKQTHSVCVCTIHQNVKSMLSAIELDKSYHDLIEMIACSRDSKICMIHRCDNCRGTEPVTHFLQHYMKNAPNSEEDEDSDEFQEMEIEFKQWTTPV